MSFFSCFRGAKCAEVVSHRVLGNSRRRRTFESLEERRLLVGSTMGFDDAPFGIGATEDAGEYYYHFSEKIPLLRLKDEFVVRVSSTLDRASVDEALIRSSKLPASD